VKACAHPPPSVQNIIIKVIHTTKTQHMSCRNETVFPSSEININTQLSTGKPSPPKEFD
jgi:hypothetical protein